MHDDVTIGQVRQQVIGLERGYSELRQELHSVEQKMDKGFSAIAAKLDEKTTPHWQAYGVLVTILIAIGGAIIWPIREQASKNDVLIEALRAQVTSEVIKGAKDLSFLQGQLHPLPKP